MGGLVLADNAGCRDCAGFPVLTVFRYTPVWWGMDGLGVADNVSCRSSSGFTGTLFRYTTAWRGMGGLGVADNVSYRGSAGFTLGLCVIIFVYYAHMYTRNNNVVLIITESLIKSRCII